jgi:hypothetical protein
MKAMDDQNRSRIENLINTLHWAHRIFVLKTRASFGGPSFSSEGNDGRSSRTLSRVLLTLSLSGQFAPLKVACVQLSKRIERQHTLEHELQEVQSEFESNSLALRAWINTFESDLRERLPERDKRFWPVWVALRDSVKPVEAAMILLCLRSRDLDLSDFLHALQLEEDRC